MQLPLISICIPTYNGEKYLQEALDSVKNQTYKNIEVTVSDDHSIDRTLGIVENFKKEVDFPVYIYSHQPSGIGANWNNCIQKSNGEYIKLLFQDDILLPNCVEVMYQYLIKNNLEIVISKRTIIDAQSKIVLEGVWYKNFHDLQNPANIYFKDFIVFKKQMINEINFDRFLIDNIFGEPCVSLFSKKLFNNVGKFDTNIKQCLDYVYFLRILNKYDIGIIEDKLVSFRIHSEQTSNVNSNNQLDESNKLVDAIFNLFFWNLSNENKKLLIKAKHPRIYKTLFKLRYKL